MLNEADHHASDSRWGFGESEIFIADLGLVAGMHIDACGVSAGDAASAIVAETVVEIYVLLVLPTSTTSSRAGDHEILSREVRGREPVSVAGGHRFWRSWCYVNARYGVARLRDWAWGCCSDRRYGGARLRDWAWVPILLGTRFLGCCGKGARVRIWGVSIEFLKLLAHVFVPQSILLSDHVFVEYSIVNITPVEGLRGVVRGFFEPMIVVANII